MNHLIRICILLLVLTGCRGAHTISNKVTSAEYEIYSAFLQDRYAGRSPDNLYLSYMTMTYDPLKRCRSAVDNKTLDMNLARQLHDLGDAMFRLDIVPPSANIKLPWPYRLADRFDGEPPRPYHLLIFSRVAFNREQTEAFFAFDDVCGGLCGGGGGVFGHRQRNSKWQFVRAGCLWVA